MNDYGSAEWISAWRRDYEQNETVEIEGIVSIEIEGLIALLAIDDFVPCLELLGHVFRSYNKEADGFIDLREYQCKQTNPDCDQTDRRR